VLNVAGCFTGLRPRSTYRHVEGEGEEFSVKRITRNALNGKAGQAFEPGFALRWSPSRPRRKELLDRLHQD
jgi:hypothetical protein